MRSREALIQNYFQSWLVKDGSQLEKFFTDKTLYVECYGPQYYGLRQIRQWFMDWNTHGTVLHWTISRFIHQNQFTAAEWTFACLFDGKNSSFDGISLIEFSDDNHMICVKEFRSSLPHVMPYADEPTR